MTTPLTDDELLAIRARHAASTKGEWRCEASWNNGGIPLADLYIPGHNSGASVEMMLDDATFIVHAHQDVPRMLAEIDRLRADLAGVGKVLSDAVARYVAAEEDCVALAGIANHYAPDNLIEVEVLVGEEPGARPEADHGWWTVDLVHANGARVTGSMLWRYEQAVAHARFMRDEHPTIASTRLVRFRRQETTP